MGTISKGILGGFSGTVGTVVGGSWKGISYMRSRSAGRTNAPSQAQLEQQAKFAVGMKFVQPLAGLLSLSFKSFADKMSGINNAFSYALKNAVTGSFPNYSIDYSLVLVSRGDLPNGANPAASAIADSIVTFTWTDNTKTGKAKTNDRALLVVYCPALNQVVYTTGSAARGSGTDTLAVSTFTGRRVETFIGFISQDGKDVSNSIYTGGLTIS
ncbi:MAG: DUF6266 family protein [Ferruginibacter sp.]